MSIHGWWLWARVSGTSLRLQILAERMTLVVERGDTAPGLSTPPPSPARKGSVMGHGATHSGNRGTLCQPLDTGARLGRALLRSPRACPIVSQTHPVLLSLGAAILVHEVRGPTCHLWTQTPDPLQAIMQLHMRDDTHIMNRHSSTYRDCDGKWSLP